MSDSVRIKHFLINSHYRSLDGLIRINQFYSVNPKIAQAKIRVVKQGKISGRVSLVCFGHRLSTVEAIHKLRASHLRPLTLQEGLLFSFLRPDVQRHMTVVLAGTPIEYPAKTLWVARLDGTASKRRLNLGSYYDEPFHGKYTYFGWPEHCYFAAIKETH